MFSWTCCMLYSDRSCTNFIVPLATHQIKQYERWMGPAELELTSIKIILRHLFVHGAEVADGTALAIMSHFLPITAYVTLLSGTKKSPHSNCHTWAQGWYKSEVKCIWYTWLRYSLNIKHATWSKDFIKELDRAWVAHPSVLADTKRDSLKTWFNCPLHTQRSPTSLKYYIYL